MAKKIEMTFVCNQDWEQMKISGHGRRCEVCCRTVHDFSGKSIDEVERMSGDELCGMFQAEQIESDLTPIEVPFSLRAALWTVATFLGLELSQAHGQELNQRHRIENVVKTDTVPATKATSNQDNLKSHEHSECKNIKRPIRSKYYFSRRFPFIVKRRVRLVGRFRI